MSQIRASFGAEADKLVSTLGTGGALKTKINAEIRKQGILEATEVRDLHFVTIAVSMPYSKVSYG